MLIATNWQRQGLGRRLLRHVEARLFERHGELALESFKDNAPANAFYRKHGWRESRSFVDAETGIEKVEFRKAKA